MTIPLKGRGTAARPPGRFERLITAPLEPDADSTPTDDEPPKRILTEVRAEPARSIITRNQSPDLPFDQSINPYRGCEHGCIYCFARPSHAYVGLSPGLDFETKLFYKKDAAALLDLELSRPAYQCKPIMLGTNTDPYQPIEREYGVTRSLLEVLWRHRHPVSILTKGGCLERDIELIGKFGRAGLASVTLSLPTLDPDLKRILEPRATSAASRLRLLRQLREAGVPAGILVAPLIPAINDAELEAVLEAAAAAGAQHAGYVFLRLPFEVAELFRDWLQQHYPDRAAHVMSLVQAARGGRNNDSRFGARMRGEGAWVQILRQRFHLASRRLKLVPERRLNLDCTQFRKPTPASRAGQLSLDLPDA